MSLIVNGTEITDLIVIDRQGNRVEIEKLQDQLGNILFQKSSAPAWFNYTGIDANGNIEGTTAYDGVAVAYGIGKPTLTTAEDGTVTVSDWASANGLNDEYFTEKYGDAYVKRFNGNKPNVSSQVVEDILVIPDTYKGKPITTLFEESFNCYSYASTGSAQKWWQPYFYKGIVFGANLTTLYSNFEGTDISKIVLPNTIQYLSCSFATGGTSSGVSNNIVEINSNVQLPSGEAAGITQFRFTTIYGETVTEVNDLLKSTAGSVKWIWVFKQPADLNVTITFSSKPKTAISSMTIYTDNNSIKNYDWSTNANCTPTFKALSEYVE